MTVPKLLLLLAALTHLSLAQTTVILTSSLNPSPIGTVNLTAIITPSNATGGVTFYDGANVLGTRTLASGTASLPTPLLPVGIRKLRAFYAGDATHAASSGSLIQTVIAQPNGGFAARSPLTTPVSKVFAIGDFNGDGKADLVFNDGTVFFTIGVLLGNGNGTFQPPSANTSLGAGFTVGSAAVGDFNGDGKADLVVQSFFSNDLKILLGNGNGTFQAPATYQFPAPTFVAVSDFNGDGKADLVAIDGGGNISIVLGNGDGTFQTAIAAGSTSSFIVTGDFNVDGKADLATVSGSSVSILLGKGDGTFQPPVTYTLSSTGGNLAVGDFNGDTNPDLAILNAPNVTILRGKGDGTFQPPVTYAGPVGISSVAVADLNGDGNADLVFNGGSFRAVAALLGKGDGTFQLPAYYPDSFNNSSLFIGEFNGDGRTDIVFIDGNFLLGSSVSVTPSGTPQSATIGSPFPALIQVTVKDGANPIGGTTVTFAAPAATLSNTTAITQASGVAGVSATAGSLPGTYLMTATALGVSTSFLLTNLVGPPSIITASPTLPQSTLLATTFPKLLQVTLTDSAGNPASGVTVTFTAPTSGPSAFLSSGSVITDGSGTASVTAFSNSARGSYTVTARFGALSANFSLTNLQATAVTLATSGTPSTFGAPVTLTATVPNATATGKVTFFDGVNILGTKPVSAGTASLSTILLPAGVRKLTAYYRDDAFVVGTSNVVTQTVRAVAGGAFVSQPLPGVSPASSSVVGDFNGDGKADVAFVSSNAVIVLLGKGDGTFQTPVSYPAGSASATSIVAGDFNGDGNTDFAVATFTLTAPPQGIVNVSILLGNGNGTFRPAVNYPAGTNGFPIGAMAVGDFNSDLKADLILAYATNVSGSVSVSGASLLPGNGDGTFGTPLNYANFGGPPLAVADFNGDGKADLALGSTPDSHGLFVAHPLILPGNGDGTTQTSLSLSLGVSGLAFSLVSGDFNADGKTDLAMGGIATGANDVATTWILLGNGDGTFQPAISYPLGSVVTSGDFNGDGITDLVSPVGILLGNGDGTFRQGPAIAAGTPLAVADFNGDGRADILTANFNNGTATILLGAPGPTITITATGGTPQSASAGTPFASPLQVTVMNNGAPSIGTAVTFTAPTTGASAVLSPSTAVTNTSGIASVNAIANNIVGSYSVTATVGTLTASFALTNLTSQTSNLAQGKTATQSSTFPGFATDSASAAVDGSTDGDFFHGSVTHTNADPNAWWQVDLGSSATVNSIVIWNRTDCCSTRLNDYWVFVSDTPFGPNDTPATLQNRAATFSSHQTATPNPFTSIAPGAVQGRYVRVQLAGTNNLSLAEVQVNGTAGPAPANLAQGKTATQSSTLTGFDIATAAAAVDGSTDGNFFHNSVTHTNADPNAWWQVDLGASATVNSVVIWNRTDCCGDRLSDYWVFVSDTPFGPADTPATLQNRAGTFAIHQTGAPNPSTALAAGATGRYVRVQLNGVGYLSLAEVQVLGTGAPAASNLSFGKTATQSSMLSGFPTAVASGAVDGITDGNFFNGSVTHTDLNPNPWWQVDLGASATVNSIVIWNRTDCCSTRLSDYWVFVSDTPFGPSDTPAMLQNRPGTFGSHQTIVPNPSITIPMGTQGRYVRVQLNGAGYLSLAEVQVLGTGAPAVSNLSRGKAAAQSSMFSGSASAGAAVDGNTDGSFFNGSITHTNLEANPWWQVDLGAAATVNSIVIWNRTDCCSTRLNDYWVFISNAPFSPSDTPSTLQNRAGTFSSHQTTVPNPSTTITLAAQGRYVRVQLSGTNYLSLAEVQVFGQ